MRKGGKENATFVLPRPAASDLVIKRYIVDFRREGGLPRPTLSAVASLLIQKDTQESTTIKMQGT